MSDLGWLSDVSAEHSDLTVHGKECVVTWNDEHDPVVEVDGERYQEDIIYLADVTFRNDGDPEIDGVGVAVGMDAEVEWNMDLRMTPNDVCNVVARDDAFTVQEAIHMENNDYMYRDEITMALRAIVTRHGVGAMLSNGQSEAEEWS